MSQSSLAQNSDVDTMFLTQIAAILHPKNIFNIYIQNLMDLLIFACSRRLLCIGFLRETRVTRLMRHVAHFNLFSYKPRSSLFIQSVFSHFCQIFFFFVFFFTAPPELK